MILSLGFEVVVIFVGRVPYNLGCRMKSIGRFGTMLSSRYF